MGCPGTGFSGAAPVGVRPTETHNQFVKLAEEEDDSEDDTPWIGEGWSSQGELSGLTAAPAPTPPPPPVPAAEMHDRLKISRRLHRLDELIEEFPKDDDLQRERAEILADMASVPWRRKRRQQHGCAGGGCCKQVSVFGGPP